MTFPNGAILDVLVELQINGVWTDITTYAFASPDTGKRISITRGRTGEGWQIDPAHAELELNNADGRFSIRNPRSPYYGYLNRNTPIRISVKPHLTDTTTGMADLTDTFTRTVALGDSWGTSDTGQTWTKSSASAANKLSVSSGTGRLLLSSANTTVRAVLDSGSYMDYDLYATFTTPVSTGANLVPCAITSRRDALAANGGVFQVTTTTAGAVQLQVLAATGSALGATVTVSGLTHTGQALRVRVRFAGNTTQAKCWDASGAEPTDWQIARTDTVATDTVMPPGTVAIACSVPVGNTNTPFTAQYDNVAMTAIEPRFTGLTAEMPTRWGPGAPDTGQVWVPVDCAGVIRQLNDQRGTAASAIERYVRQSTTVPKGYWTLSDVGKALTTAPVALAARSIVGSGSATWVGLVTGRSDGSDQSAKLGQGTFNAPWIPNGVTFGNDGTGDQILMDFTQVPYDGTAGWAIDWVRTGPKVSGAAVEVFVIAMTGYLAGEGWNVTLDQATTSVIILDVNGVSHSTSLSTSAIFDGLPHCLRFQVTLNSATTLRYQFWVDGVSVVNATMTPTDMNGPGKHYFWLLSQSDTATAVTYGHMLLWDGASPPAASDVSDAVLGYAGETSADRVARVAAEAGLAYQFVGQTNATTQVGETLGPQDIGTTYDALKAAVDADAGLLFELPDALGLGYRIRSTMYSQARQLDLTYTTDGHLDPPLEPVDDLRGVANLVTATRLYGGAFTAELTSGALSTLAQPSGIGQVPADVTLALADDDRTQDAAEWRVAVGTVDESRWPAIRMSIGHLLTHGLTTMAAALMRTVFGDRLTIDTLPDFLPPAEVDQLVQGWSEVLDQRTWTLVLVTAPAAPYAIGLWSGSPDEYAGRWDVEDSTLSSGATSSATSLSVASPTTLWTTTGGDFPFDLNIAGVRITVTAISGASSPQTFTVTRSVDGFDLALTASTKVSLWRPSRWGM